MNAFKLWCARVSNLHESVEDAWDTVGRLETALSDAEHMVEQFYCKCGGDVAHNDDGTGCCDDCGASYISSEGYDPIWSYSDKEGE